MSAADFLFELGTEELPPKALPGLERALTDGIVAGLASAGLAHGEVESYAAPRRLAVLVRDLSREQPEQQIKRRGPPVKAAFDASGAPTRAATAFAASCGTTPDRLERVTEGKGEFLFYSGRQPGASATALLPAIVQAALDALPIPKRMRWGAGEAEFVRPVHWVVMLHGNDVVEATLLDTPAGRVTRGHRFHAPAELELGAPADYASLLRERGKVLASFAERRERIRAGVTAAAAELGGRALIHDSLLDEVTALVEWPVPVAGRFEERFLELPREVLISTLQEHQRYFPIEKGPIEKGPIDTASSDAAGGELTAHFITISNIESRDPAAVRAGNERVVRPRLADAEFFYRQDRAQPLAARLPGLDAVTFQAKLGSVGARVQRIMTLAERISAYTGADVSHAKRCAELSKCDLLTSMVGEFPELQGIMGSRYASADGEPADVATGIREHYLPRGGGDALPTTAVGTAVALAEKLDTLSGIFAIGQKPTGTRDPFGLRRAAIGVLRILIEKGIDLDLRALVDLATSLQPVQSAGGGGEVYAYILDRLGAYYLEPATADMPAVTSEMLEAVLAAGPVSPLDIDHRLRALADFLQAPEAASLAAANKRIANILRKAGETPTAVDAQRLVEPAERELHNAVAGIDASVRAATRERDYVGALRTLSTLRPTVDAFFDAVMVMDPDEGLRRNRLALLAGVRELFSGIADLSRLPG